MAKKFSLTKYMVEVFEQYINGEIDQEDFSLTMDAIATAQKEALEQENAELVVR